MTVEPQNCECEPETRVTDAVFVGSLLLSGNITAENTPIIQQIT